MATDIFEIKSRINVPAAEAFRWHERPGALQRLTPPWQPVRILSNDGGIKNGASTVLQTKWGPFPLKWTALHKDYQSGQQFKDVQTGGPFSQFEHTHRFIETGNSCYMEDHIEYRLPFGKLGQLIGGAMIREKLQRAFEYRHRILKFDLDGNLNPSGSTLNILVTGASGLIGSVLVPMYTAAGHRVERLVRKKSAQPDEVTWDPQRGLLDGKTLEGLDAVVHLAGENISGRWSAAKKKRIMDSRIQGTRLLCETLARLEHRPKVLVCASAIGFYGNRGDEVLTESSAAGSGFLADVCRDWESCTKAANDAGIRVVNLRLGIVLTPAGGALAQMLTPFQFCVGGAIGSGKQYWSWIAVDDVVGCIHHAIMNDKLRGAVNATAPGSLTNAEFTRVLGKVLQRPTLLPMPSFAARLALGEMADALLLSSARVQPQALIDTAYSFRFRQLEPALRHLLGIS